MAGVKSRTLGRPLKTKDRYDRFKDRLINDNERESSYEDKSEITTELNISQGADGELKVVCESPKYARYLVQELSKIKDENGDGLVCFYANSTEGCACFYIAGTDKVKAGQKSIRPDKERIIGQQTNYGVYPSRQEISGRVFYMLAMNCPDGFVGRSAILELLGLKTMPTVTFKDADYFVISDGKHDSSFYFNDAKLPFILKEKKESKESSQQPRKTITTQITINNGLREAFKEQKKTALKPSSIQTYTGKDTALLLSAVMKITDSATHLTWKGEKKNAEDEQIIIRNGTVYHQYGYHGNDYENISLKWVRSDDGILKLAVSYYAYADQCFTTTQQQATYLITFDEQGSSITTEKLATPALLGISQASIYNPKTGIHEPIPGNVIEPDGGAILDILLEWGRELGSDRLKSVKKKQKTEEDKAKSGLPARQKNAPKALMDSLCRNNLLAPRSEHSSIVTTLGQVAGLYDAMLVRQESNINLKTYNNRLQAVLTILDIVQNIEDEEKPVKDDLSKAPEPTEPAAVGGDLTISPEIPTSAAPSPTKPQRDKNSNLTETERQELIKQFKIFLDNDPPWQERSLANNILRGFLCITIIGIIPVLIWNHAVYQDHVQRALDIEKGVLADDKDVDFEMSGWKKWGLA